MDEPTHRRRITKQAWTWAQAQVRELYEQRRAELLTEAGLPPHRARRRRDDDFRQLVLDMLTARQFDHDLDALDRVERFLRRPDLDSRNSLSQYLHEHDELFGEYSARFAALMRGRR